MHSDLKKEKVNGATWALPPPHFNRRGKKLRQMLLLVDPTVVWVNDSYHVFTDPAQVSLKAA